MSVTEFPPTVMCERCRVPLRVATRNEIAADATDARYRHIALQAAQGDRAFHVEDDDPLGTALAGIDGAVPRPAWLLRCDRCGLRLLHHRMAEP